MYRINSAAVGYMQKESVEPFVYLIRGSDKTQDE